MGVVAAVGTAVVDFDFGRDDGDVVVAVVAAAAWEAAASTSGRVSCARSRSRHDVDSCRRATSGSA